MRAVLIRLAGIVTAMVTLTGCSTLSLFDAFVPKDADSRRIAHDIAYGPGERQKLNVYAPTSAGDSQALPVIFFIYGGSWKNGDKDLYDFAGRALAAKGFVTVIADYRLVPEVRFPAFLEDGAMAVKWVEDNIASYGGDAERFYVAGHSAGAYNAVMLAVDPQWLKGAGVDPDIVDAAAGLSGPYDFYPWDTDVSREAFRGAPDPAQTTQPVALIGPEAPPLFLITGTDDDTVKPSNVEALASTAEEKGVRVVTHFYEDVDHAGSVAALSRPFRGSAPVLEDMVAFFRSVEE